MSATAKEEVGDESDSCFEFIKQRNLAKAGLFKDIDQDINSKATVVSVVPVKVTPVKVGLSSSPLKHKIDRIAETLKAKQEMKQTSMPRVVPVKPKSIDEKLKGLKISAKELAHHLIVLRSRKMNNSDLELSVNLTTDNKKKNADLVEMSDDLTNLSWLTTFNLTTKSMSLSPPCSPPLSPHANNQYSSILDDDEDSPPSIILTLIQPWQTGRQRPPFSYSGLAFLAIEASPKKRLDCKEIYTFITNNFPYYRSVPSGSWKNSIRHNLAHNNSCFSKVDKNMLAMRDFSGKGSLWCISNHAQARLSEALERSPPEQLTSLLNLSLLQDSPERFYCDIGKQLIMPSPNYHKQSQNQSKAPKHQHPARSLSALPPVVLPSAIINPKLAQKLTFATRPTPSSHCPSDIDAVNALLSMKSRSASMPARPECAKQGRRKQVFKPPMKKPHLNPKLFQSNKPFFYNDGGVDEEEDEIDEDLDEDEEGLAILKNKQKLQIKFPRYVSHSIKKEETDKHIVTMSDDEEEEEDDDRRLQIDEAPEKMCLTEELNPAESNESYLEPGEIRKPIVVNQTTEALIKTEMFEKEKEIEVVSKREEPEKGEYEEDDEALVKRQRITEPITPRTTRSRNAKLIVATNTPVTRSAGILTRKKSK